MLGLVGLDESREFSKPRLLAGGRALGPGMVVPATAFLLVGLAYYLFVVGGHHTA